MLDRYLHPLLKPPLKSIVRLTGKLGLSADQFTVLGFLVGLLAVPFIIFDWYVLALLRFVSGRSISHGLPVYSPPSVLLPRCPEYVLVIQR